MPRATSSRASRFRKPTSSAPEPKAAAAAVVPEQVEPAGENGGEAVPLGRLGEAVPARRVLGRDERPVQHDDGGGAGRVAPAAGWPCGRRRAFLCAALRRRPGCPCPAPEPGGPPRGPSGAWTFPSARAAKGPRGNGSYAFDGCPVRPMVPTNPHGSTAMPACSKAPADARPYGSRSLAYAPPLSALLLQHLPQDSGRRWFRHQHHGRCGHA